MNEEAETGNIEVTTLREDIVSVAGLSSNQVLIGIKRAPSVKD